MHAHHWRKLEAYLLTDQDLATSTTKKLLRFCRLLERGGVDLLRPRRDRYRRFMADRKASGRDGPGSRHYARAMKHALAWRGKFWPNFRLPRARCNRRAVLPDAVIQAALDYAPDDVGELQARVARSCFRLIFYFLVRPPSEVFALKVTDIDETHRRLNVKMDKLDEAEEEELQEWEVDVLREALATRAAVLEATRAWRSGPADDSLVLDPGTGRAFASVEALGMFLRRSIKRVWPRARPYDLRHAGATFIAIIAGREAARRRLRHKPGSQHTATYDHSAEKLRHERTRRLRPFTGSMVPDEKRVGSGGAASPMEHEGQREAEQPEVRVPRVGHRGVGLDESSPLCDGCEAASESPKENEDRRESDSKNGAR